MSSDLFPSDTVLILRGDPIIGQDIKYRVIDTRILMADNGSWDVGLMLFNSNRETQEFVPYSYFKELYLEGELYIEGNERAAMKLKMLAARKRRGI